MEASILPLFPNLPIEATCHNEKAGDLLIKVADTHNDMSLFKTLGQDTFVQFIGRSRRPPIIAAHKPIAKSKKMLISDISMKPANPTLLPELTVVLNRDVRGGYEDPT